MQAARDIAVTSLSQVGLGPELLDVFPAALSGGMQKRVGLARAIASKPDIIFFDEPTTGLDPIMTDVINHLIRDCVRELGATTLTITHDMTSVRAIADKTALLYQGRIIWQGTTDELEQSDDPFLNQFINGLAHGPIEVEGQTVEATVRGCLMAKNSQYVCNNCGHVSSKWSGKCDACGAWNAMTEEPAGDRPPIGRGAKAPKDARSNCLRCPVKTPNRRG